MPVHNFDRSLQHEREFAGRADLFYRKHLNANAVMRYNGDNAHDMSFQRRDIDVALTINGKNYNVSEKFRDTDFGDLYLEVYSKYPHTRGWIHSGESDFIAYFTPGAVYLISSAGLRHFCLNIFFPEIPAGFYSEIFKSGKTKVKKTIVFPGEKDEKIEISIIQAHNQTGNSSWKTIGVTAGFDLLSRYGVRWKKFT
jgi:hypothetical protein